MHFSRVSHNINPGQSHMQKMIFIAEISFMNISMKYFGTTQGSANFPCGEQISHQVLNPKQQCFCYHKSICMIMSIFFDNIGCIFLGGGRSVSFLWKVNIKQYSYFLLFLVSWIFSHKLTGFFYILELLHNWQGIYVERHLASWGDHCPQYQPPSHARPRSSFKFFQNLRKLTPTD